MSETVKNLIISIRPRQWLKNGFIFAPLLFAQKIFHPPSIFKTAATFTLFCLMSAAVYLVNDTLDIQKDKLHPVKKNRPIASGKLNIKPALFCAFAAASISLFSSCLLTPWLAFILLTYFISNIAYSKIFKDLVIIDAMCFALFFILRIAAGAAVIKVELSHWITICTGLLALFIAFGKRHHELKLLEKEAANHRPVLEKYSPKFIEQMITVTAASLAVFYTLYTVDSRTLTITGGRNLLVTVPFAYYGIFRYYYNLFQLNKGGDPTEIILNDKKLQITAVLWIIAVLGVLYF